VELVGRPEPVVPLERVEQGVLPEPVLRLPARPMERVRVAERVAADAARVAGSAAARRR
jgi:hypothetical protein